MSISDERQFFGEASPQQKGLLASRSARRSGDPRIQKYYEGHRQRLRTRFSEAGAEALSDYELLELLLFRTFPRADTKGLAKTLIEAFGSIAEVFGAPPHRLREIPGAGDAVVQDLKLVEAIMKRALRAQVQRKHVLSSWMQVLDYCRATMAFEEREQFRILFLDKKNCLIRDECQQVGTVDHTPVYPREVIRRALELSASALILVHNHPSGDPNPSRADIEMTKLIITTAQPLGITVHDHIIIGKHGHASMKGMSLI